MQQLKDIRENILSVAGEGEILIIVPPFGSINDVALGPHILQAAAREKGYQTDILYLNILLASIIGVERYEDIYSAPESWMLGERLFARSAYGLPPLGKHPESSTDEALSIKGSIANQKILNETHHYFDPHKYLAAEQVCKSFLDEVSSIITDLDYKIIGCTVSMMRQTNCCIALLNYVKKHSPGTITIIGGSSCKDEMAQGTASLSEAIDYIFSGESEISFLNFLKGYSVHKLPPRRIIGGEQPGDLDTLPLADYEIFFKQYARFLGENAPAKTRIWYETSRGCWWAEKSKCTFCSEHHGISYRQKSVNKVVDDLERISQAYPQKLLSMADIIMPHSYHRELLPLISKKEGFPSLGYQVRATLDLHDLVNLKNAKIDVILPGIETFSSHLLKLMKKGATGWQNLLFLRNVASVGIFAYWYLLWGFPGDRISDYEEVLRILPLIRHLQAPKKFISMVLMRFSPYLENQQKYKITNVQPWAVLDKVYPDGIDLEKLATYYTGEFPSQVYQNPEIIREIANQVITWQKTWRNTTVVMGPFMDAFAIYDNRDIHNKAKTHILDYQQAKEIMTSRFYNESESLKWAAAEKLGVVIDSRYVPLVTASPGLLLEFEKK